MKKFILTILTMGVAVTLVAGDKDAKCEGKCEKACCKDAAKVTKAGAEKSPYAKVAFQISNVSCEESCGELTKTIAGLKGVKGQEVCAASKMAAIEYKEGETCSKTIASALMKAGYKIEAQQVTLKVNGMHCAGCAANLTTAFSKLDGVKKSDVCHEKGEAVVAFDPAKLDESKIADLVAKTGYTVAK